MNTDKKGELSSNIIHFYLFIFETECFNYD
jgi:hypothetical protein